MRIEHIFRAYDIRGVFNKDLTSEVATRIGLAFGAYLGGTGKVLVARDVRTSSEIIENAFCAGLASTGCDVVSIGMVPIPVANFTTMQGDYKAGAYITASHNPPEYNGVRFRREDGSGYTEENKEVKKIFLKGDFELAGWNELGRIEKVSTDEAIESYSKYILDRVSLERKLKVVLDTGNGAAIVTAKGMFEDLGAEVKVINAEPDGTFPGRPSEPSDKTLGDLRKAVLEHSADFGAGFDGDGDRVIFVDNKGRTVQTEKIGIIIARKLLKEKKGPVIANVSCSMIVEEEIKKLGGEVKRVRVGDVFVCEAIREHGAIFAMETSAHFFMPSFYIFDDPVAVALTLASILSRQEKSLAQLVDEIPSYPFVERNFECPDEVKFKVTEEIVKSFREKGLEIDLTDGAKVNFNDGWILLRPSNTTPLIRSAAEAKSKDRLEELMSIVKKEFNKAMEEVVR